MKILDALRDRAAAKRVREYGRRRASVLDAVTRSCAPRLR